MVFLFNNYDIYFHFYTNFFYQSEPDFFGDYEYLNYFTMRYITKVIFFTFLFFLL